MTLARTSVSTGLHAFFAENLPETAIEPLTIAWNVRHALTDSERRGFAQFFYLTISGHTESVLSKIVGARVSSIQSLTVQSPRPSKLDTEEDLVSYLDHESSVRQSFHGITSSLKAEVETAPLSKLLGLYKKVFQKSLRDVIGKELSEDLDALGALRNTMAHGRDLYLAFDEERRKPNEFFGPITLDGNPLKKAAERLKKSGILSICVSDIDTMNWDGFLSDFYCDDALLYFYRAVIQVEDKLRACSDDSFEVMSSYVPPLPDLDEDSN